MKYIVKNCPCLKTTKYYLRDKLITERICTFDREEFRLCQSCTNCLIKRVIDEVEWEIKTIPNENNRGDLAERILSMFEIESEEE